MVREHSTEGYIWWGEYNRPFSGREVQRPAHAAAGVICKAATCFVQDCYRRRRSRLPPAHPHRHRKAWHSLFARNMFMKPESLDEPTAAMCPSSRSSRARLPRQSAIIDGTRTETFIIMNFWRSGWPSSAAPATAARSRRPSSRCSTPLLAAGRRAAHALLGQRRPVRRRGHFLRPLRHRQDHPLGRPRAQSDRRRRAWLERQRRLQLRGWLLRQGHPPLRKRRAADLRLHAPLRHDFRKRGLRPAHPPPRSERRQAHRKHARAYPLDYIENALPEMAAIRATSSS
jgi:hypothetical protein